LQPLEPVHVKFLSLQVDVAELDRAKFADPQTVPEHEKHHAIVADRITRTGFACRKKPLDFLLGKILSAPGFSE
jgi:hypothetical protein